MSPSPAIVLASLAALSLLALPATAQAPGGSVTISGLAAQVDSSQTQEFVPFTVQVALNQGTCVGGTSQLRVDLTATRTGGGNATVEVQPPSLTFQVRDQTVSGSYSGSGGAQLVVKPGLVRENVTVPVTVKATATVACSVTGVGMAPPAPLTAEGRSTLRFVPVSEEVRTGPTEALPGLEVPAILAAVALAAFFASRRKA